MCDCFSAHGSPNQVINYAGVYCEHQATSYCQSGSDVSAHAFCTNGGECKHTVGRTEAHAGCKCPRGYEGDFCQFVKGSMPSDWTLDNFMHPSLASVYENGGSSRSGNGAMFGALIGVAVALVLIAIFVLGFIHGPSRDLPSLNTLYVNAREKLRLREKESDTGDGDETASLGGRRSSVVASTENTSFVGGSVYKKKSAAVTSDTLEADGGVLTEALGTPASGEEDFEDVDQKTLMEDVNLNDERAGELA